MSEVFDLPRIQNDTFLPVNIITIAEWQGMIACGTWPSANVLPHHPRLRKPKTKPSTKKQLKAETKQKKTSEASQQQQVCSHSTSHYPKHDAKMYPSDANALNCTAYSRGFRCVDNCGKEAQDGWYNFLLQASTPLLLACCVRKAEGSTVGHFVNDFPAAEITLTQSEMAAFNLDHHSKYNANRSKGKNPLGVAHTKAYMMPGHEFR